MFYYNKFIPFQRIYSDHVFGVWKCARCHALVYTTPGELACPYCITYPENSPLDKYTFKRDEQPLEEDYNSAWYDKGYDIFPWSFNNILGERSNSSCLEPFLSPPVRNKENITTVYPGWSEIVFDLCITINQILNVYQLPSSAFIIVQIKEKFGGLRVYTELQPPEGYPAYYLNEANKLIQIAIETATYETEQVCYICGRKADGHTVGWVMYM